MSEWAGLGTSKKETFLKVKAPHEMKKIFKQKIFTMHNFWDTAVCLHFWTGTKLGPIMYFVNKQLTYFIKKSSSCWFLKQFLIVWVKQTFSEILNKIENVIFEKIEIKHQLFVYKKCLVNNFFFVFNSILTKLCEIVVLMYSMKTFEFTAKKSI